MKQPGALLAAEVAEIPAVIDRQLRDNRDGYLALGRDWADTPPAFFATCARGTSDQAALFFKYLTEIGTGIPVAPLGPSVALGRSGALENCSLELLEACSASLPLSNSLPFRTSVLSHSLTMARPSSANTSAPLPRIN